MGIQKTPQTASKKNKIKAAAARKRPKRDVSEGRLYIQATFNNTIITITDMAGDVIAWQSSGASGFKHSRKSTPYAAQVAADVLARRVFESGLRKLEIFVMGPGPGRESAMRAFINIKVENVKFEIKSITDRTPIPHNGCKPPKRRRV
jgi:small subunit ribosomal protein S11